MVDILLHVQVSRFKKEKRTVNRLRNNNVQLENKSMSLILGLPNNTPQRPWFDSISDFSQNFSNLPFRDFYKLRKCSGADSC